MLLYSLTSESHELKEEKEAQNKLICYGKMLL